MAAGFRWYFAYGLNLNLRNLVDRVGEPYAFYRGVLPGFKLEFSKSPGGYATVVPCAEGFVEGVLYLLSGEQLEGLDRVEGVPGHYVRRGVLVWCVERMRWVEADTYVAVRRDRSLRPRRGYVEAILEGARLHGLSEKWIHFLEEVLRQAV